ncbi:hypothetical protein D9757_009026 [Collybiopsis confluens]|uniref:PPIase cyclophilin-type domain-containing protein n=1 Tax=Collybiopsis confluens TaxID=2823264 RepID=A0A8H5M5B8_9AGAR|nr:hypothetical protein D9757_013293 [Collybiopsis confluens]KAF5381443.1 hypothetical protein D9757_009026 [Collybiopsis confluens]
MALPTAGRVIIDTTVGEVDIELWSKETPKTCRNFLALAMEGYYDGVIFHRVIPNFLVQTGDKTGTGMGGESFYGGAHMPFDFLYANIPRSQDSVEPFEDEIHPRLRFAHRGLVAMANNGQKNTNDSQFFITLDRADELHGKHTLFGRCIGDTLYNALKIGELELDANERPVYPPKIKGIRIIDNPFPDIVPRITAAERRAQQRAREGAQKEREEYERRKGAKKDVKLLSFGADEGEEEGEPAVFTKKAIVRPDLIDQPSQAPRVSGVLPDFVTQGSKASQPAQKKVSSEGEDRVQKKKQQDDEELSKIREKHAAEKASSSTARQTEISKMEAEIRKLSKRDDSDDDEERKKKKPKVSYLEAELSKYASNRGTKGKKGKRRDEGDVLDALNAFRGKLQQALHDEPDDDEPVEVEGGDGESAEVGSVPGPGGTDDPGMEVDDDRGFLGHALRFPKDDGEETRKAERDYEVIDPRQRGARAREEERERKAKLRPRDGGRGFKGSSRGGGGGGGGGGGNGGGSHRR